jgi:hypothetical protein
MSIFSSNTQDIFRTQADNRFNSFAEPMNPVNMNPGNWGVDPNYLTPAYLSPFRPRYQGPTGDNFNAFRPKWSTSLNQIVNPFAPGGENYGGSYWDQTTPYWDTLANSPMHGAASAMQNIVAPAAMAWGAYKYMGNWSSRFGGKVGGGFMGSLTRGLGLGAKAATHATTAGRYVGSLAAGIALPMAAVEAGVHTLDKAVFDPYVSQTRTSNSLRENFRGISYGEGNGDLFTGGGMSRKTAARIAGEVSKSSAMDRTFTQEETSMLTDYASRAGLLDNTSTSQMTQRFDGILKQVKLVMSVANTSDFKETIEIMSKMQMAGVSPNKLAGVMGTLAAAASAGGQSVQKLLNTVGAQGQYMFGAAGITPYMGQQTAFTTSASMAASFRSGLISPALMARMGGAEGATQSALGGTIASYRTPYANMQASNAYFGGGDTGNVVTNVAQFGGRMAVNPFRNIGRHEMARDALTSRHLEDRGLMGEQDRILEMARTINPNMLNGDGSIDGGTAYSILTGTMGLTHEMATAKLAQFGAYRDKKTVDQMLAGNKRAGIEQLLNYQRQESLNKGFFQGVYEPVMNTAMGMQKGGADMVGRLKESYAVIPDTIQAAWNRGMYHINDGENVEGDFEDESVNRSKNLVLADTGITGITRALRSDKLKGKIRNGNHRADLEKINDLAKNKNADAITYLDPKATKLEKKNALFRMARKGDISSDYTESSNVDALTDVAEVMGTIDTNEEGRKTNQAILKENLEKVKKGEGLKDTLEYLNLSQKIYNTIGKGGEVSKEDRARYGQLAGIAEDTEDVKLEELTGKELRQVNELRLGNVLGRKGDSFEELEKDMKKDHVGALSAKVPMRDTKDGIKAGVMQMEAQQAISKERSKILQLYKDGKIDTNTTHAMINGLDSKETIGKFDKAVTRFETAIEKINKDGDKSTGVGIMSGIGSVGDRVRGLVGRSDVPPR